MAKAGVPRAKALAAIDTAGGQVRKAIAIAKLR